MRTRHTLATVLLTTIGVAAAWAGDSPDPELTDVSAHLEAREPEKARDVIRGRLRDGRDTGDLRWSTAWSRLRRIDQHTPEMRLEQAAHAARDLGFYALEYRLWREMFETSEWANPKTRGGWAGAAAIRIGKYDEGRELLSADVQCAGGKRGAMIEAFVASDKGPNARIDFAEHFWFTPGSQWRHARAAFETILPAVQRVDLADDLVDRAYPLAYRMAVLSRQDGWAGNVLRVWVQRREAVDVLPILTAINSELDNEHFRSRAELDAILLRVLPGTNLGPVALGRTAAFLESRGDTAGAASAYRRVIASVEPMYDEPHPPTDAAAELHTTLDAARLGLAGLMEAAGRPGDALELYRKWTAWTGCGNCSEFSNAERSLHEARCLVAMGQAEEAISEHLLPHYTASNPLGGPNAQLIDFHVTLEAGRGKLDDLVRTLDGLPADTEAARRPIDVARHFVAVRRARDAADLEKLLDLLVAAGADTVFHAATYQEWEIPILVRRVTEVLAGREDAITVILRRFDALPDPDVKGDPARGVLVHALYVHPSDAAVEALRAIATRVEKGEQLGLDAKELGRRIEARLYGL